MVASNGKLHFNLSIYRLLYSASIVLIKDERAIRKKRENNLSLCIESILWKWYKTNC